MEPHWMALAALRTLTVLVSDYAGLSDRSMDEMETVSTVLLSRAGIRTQWVHCRGHQQGPPPALCDSKPEPGSVLLVIRIAYPGNPNTLGELVGTAKAESGCASIYAFKIHKYAATNGLPPGTLMAYAATHEIGHLLLGPRHSTSGIMRAVWGDAEFRGMAHRSLDFGEAERQALRRAVPVPDQRLAKLR